jgi:hypothetical protein
MIVFTQGFHCPWDADHPNLVAQRMSVASLAGSLARSVLVTLHPQLLFYTIQSPEYIYSFTYIYVDIIYTCTICE